MISVEQIKEMQRDASIVNGLADDLSAEGLSEELMAFVREKVKGQCSEKFHEALAIMVLANAAAHFGTAAFVDAPAHVQVLAAEHFCAAFTSKVVA